jgi:predicted dehydrogenase
LAQNLWQAAGKDEKKMIKVAVVGCGYWGPNLIRNFCSIPQCAMSMACDTKPERLEYIQRLYPSLEVTSDFEHILNNDEIGAVAIATPVASHFPMAQACFKRGKHVLIEKPITASVEECKELIRQANEHNRTLMVDHTFEYTAAVNKAKEIIQRGELGQIYYIDCVRVNLGLFQNDINVVWDLAPHDVSIVLYLLDQQPESVSGQGKAHLKPDIEDVATIAINFPDNLGVYIHSSWLHPNKIRKITIVGSRKMLVYDDVDPLEKIKIYDKGVEVPKHYETFGDFHFSYRYGDIYSPRLEETEPLKKVCQHFIECIENSMEPRTNGTSGLRVVSVLEAANKSLKNGGTPIAIDLARITPKELSIKH